MTLTLIGTRPVLIDGDQKRKFTDWQELVNFVKRTKQKITGTEIMPDFFKNQIEPMLAL